MLKNVPVVLEGYKLRVAEDPDVKKYTNETGKEEIQTDNNGAPMYEMPLYMRARPVEGQRTAKGFEVKVTLETEPGPDVVEGEVVELINPRISEWARNNRNGVSMRATGVKLAG